jgi:hypothetical protein
MIPKSRSAFWDMNIREIKEIRAHHRVSLIASRSKRRVPGMRPRFSMAPRSRIAQIAALSIDRDASREAKWD